MVTIDRHCSVAGASIFLLSLLALAVSFGVERWLVPDVVPVGYAHDEQPLWSLETAFVLRAIELMAAGAAGIAHLRRVGATLAGRPLALTFVASTCQPARSLLIPQSQHT